MQSLCRLELTNDKERFGKPKSSRRVLRCIGNPRCKVPPEVVVGVGGGDR